MEIKYANFIGSFTKSSQCPAPDKPEYAFIGRSNVGKSSLINMLTNRKSLARISNTPGKTQTINHFLINDEWYLVDLPGYGFAKVSKSSRLAWEKMIREYLLKRENLQCIFVLIDCRIPPQKLDLEFVNWLGEMMIPFVLVFTKADKVSDAKTVANLEAFTTEMQKKWEEMPQIFVSSATKKTGREEILQFIEEVNRNFKKGIS